MPALLHGVSTPTMPTATSMSAKEMSSPFGRSAEKLAPL